jgi:hypothetical protein
MKLRHLKRQQIERLRWRLLLQRVTEGVERCLIDLVAERCARTAAEVMAAAYRRQAKPGRVGVPAVGSTLVRVETHNADAT